MPTNPPKLSFSRNQANKLINQRAEVSKHVILTKHAKDRRDLRGINLRQIITALKSGTVIKDPSLSLKHNNWECSVRGFCAGDTLSVIVGITKNKAKVTVITVYRVRRRSNKH